MAADESINAAMNKGRSGAKLRGRFSKPPQQAAAVMKNLQGTVLRSVGTVRNYEAALTRVAEYMREAKLGALAEIDPDTATAYLRQRALTVGQKALDMERQALQSMMRHVTGKLGDKGVLEVIKSTASQSRSTPGQPTLGRRLSEESRIYTREQIGLIAARQTSRNALATEIAHAAGLRAHELLTLQRAHRQAADERPWHQQKFSGIRQGSISYTVHGKGGLVREVRIPVELARRLEALRLTEARRVTDRGIHYRQHYDLGGGQPWSKSFGAASKTALGWSNGAHGLRHTYAQERMKYLQRTLHFDEAKQIVSQELGHFRAEITDTYLR
jgi:integrase